MLNDLNFVEIPTTYTGLTIKMRKKSRLLSRQVFDSRNMWRDSLKTWSDWGQRIHHANIATKRCNDLVRCAAVWSSRQGRWVRRWTCRQFPSGWPRLLRDTEVLARYGGTRSLDTTSLALTLRYLYFRKGIQSWQLCPARCQCTPLSPRGTTSAALQSSGLEST